MSTATATENIAAILRAAQWRPLWAVCRNAFTDERGNIATIHETDETVSITFEYAMPGMVETLHLDPNYGADRIARVIIAMAGPIA